MHEDVAFYAGLAITIIGLIVWIVRPSTAPGKSAFEFPGGLKLSLDVPALGVMVIGIVLTVLSSNFHVEASPPPPPPPPSKKIVCFAEEESECDEHEIFTSCRTGMEMKGIAKLMCGDALKSSYSILKIRTNVEEGHCYASLIDFATPQGGDRSEGSSLLSAIDRGA